MKRNKRHLLLILITLLILMALNLRASRAGNVKTDDTDVSLPEQNVLDI